MGNMKISSSIGSQWKTRIKRLDKKIRDIAEDMTEDQ
ncbi:polymorphic toxin type 15 domain-containing protein [Geobacillus thermodenitrificans]